MGTEEVAAKKRTKLDIDTEYTKIATIYGDNLMKIDILTRQIEQIKAHMWKLKQEADELNLMAPAEEKSVETKA